MASMTEKLKEKVTGLKEKASGHHDQHSPTHHKPVGGAAAMTTPTQPMHPKRESFFEKVKEKLPGRHSYGHDPTKYDTHEKGTIGYRIVDMPPDSAHQEYHRGGDFGAQDNEHPRLHEDMKDTVTPFRHHDATPAAHTPQMGVGQGHEKSIGEKIKDAVMFKSRD